MHLTSKRETAAPHRDLKVITVEHGFTAPRARRWK